MRFIPASLSELVASAAERKLFQLLHELTGYDDWICFHSLRLDKHSYQTCGEIDFLLVGPRGLIAIEVKGGRISVEDGTWSYTNRYGQIHTDHRGPYRQVESALYSLIRDLASRTTISRVVQKANRGWAVALPDIAFDVATVEHDPVLTIDYADFQDGRILATAINAVVAYWWEKKHYFMVLSSDDIQSVASILRPSFDKVPLLRHQSADHQTRSVELTTQQYAILDAAKHNPRIMLSGGAGTGKSFIALEAARNLRSQGKRVLFTSLNHRLLLFLQHQPDLEGISFESWESGNGVFDFVIIDEAQDCMNAELTTRLSSLLGMKWFDGSWMMCLDPNGQANVGLPMDHLVLEETRRQAVHLELSLNCRNTEVILDQVKWATRADVGVRGTGSGPTVSWPPVTSAEDEAEVLASHLSWLVGDQGLHPSDITLLDMGQGRQTVELLPEKWKRQIYPLTTGVVRDWNSRMITFARVADFKGLENTAICVIGARGFQSLTDPINYLYVAMSRALSHLWIGTTVDLGSWVGELHLGDERVARQK
jgi:hypothetical protein